MNSKSDQAAVLKAARELISDPARWTQGRNARTALGTTCAADDPMAACWCALGALQQVSGSERASVVLALGLPPAREQSRFGIFEFNDEESTTHADVLAMFDRAIAALEAA